MKLLLFFLLLSPITVLSQSSHKGYALIIGISNYEHLDTLHYAESDARKFYEFLKAGYFGSVFDSGDVKLLISAEADDVTVGNACGRWLDSVRKKIQKNEDADIFIYFSGHGLVTPKNQMLICKNTMITASNDEDLIFATKLSDIKEQARAFVYKEGVRVYLIIDACRNAGTNEQFERIGAIARDIGGKGEFDLYATSHLGSSYEAQELVPGAGVFTYFLLLGLRGGADKSPPNGEVTFDELQTFIGDNVRLCVSKYKPGKKQWPELVADDRMKGVPITKLSLAQWKEARKTADSIHDLLDSLPFRGVSPLSAGAKMPAASKVRYPAWRADAINPTNTTGPSIDPADSSELGLYNCILDRINAYSLLLPAGASANDCYIALKKRYPGSKFLPQAQLKLYGVLVRRVKGVIDKYLQGKTSNTGKELFEQAYNELYTAIHLYPDDDRLAGNMQAKLDFLRARSLAGSNNPDDWRLGLGLLKSRLAESSKAAYLHHTEGILYQNKGRFFTARNCFDSAIKYAPDWIYPLYNSAGVNFKIQEFGKSIDSCLRIITLDSMYSRAYSLLGINYEAIADYKKSGQYGDAINWNLKALAVDSFNTTAYWNLGRIYSKILTKRNENIRLAKRYLTVGGQYGDDNCLTSLGQMYASMDIRYRDSAAYYFRRALKINPFNVTTLYDYATLLDVSGRTDQADSLFANALERSGKDYNIYSKYCSFLFTARSAAISDLNFQKLVQMNSQDPTIFIDHSRLFENAGMFEKARGILYEGMNYIPRSPSLAYELAELYFKHFNYDPFRPYALDSCKIYLNFVDSLSPEYSLVNYARYQVYALQKNDSSRAFLDLANRANQYINDTRNFSKDLLLLGDSALSGRRYNNALLYYSMAKDMNRDRFNANLGIARAYYLTHKLDSALYYVQQADRYWRSPDDRIVVSELKGLVLFEKKDFKQAQRAFLTADDERYDPDNLAQAVSLYKIKQLASASSLAEVGWDNDPNAFHDIESKAGVVYSNYFVKELRKFLTDIGKL